MTPAPYCVWWGHNESGPDGAGKEQGSGELWGYILPVVTQTGQVRGVVRVCTLVAQPCRLLGPWSRNALAIASAKLVFAPDRALNPGMPWLDLNFFGCSHFQICLVYRINCVSGQGASSFEPGRSEVEPPVWKDPRP